MLGNDGMSDRTAQDAPISLNTPLREDEVLSLRAGQQVSLSGVVYTARDAAHQRMQEALLRGEELPFELSGQVIYYTGPSPAAPGRIIGACGPTTAGRMDRYTPALLARGLKAMIGKGGRSEEVREALKKHRAVYFGAIGGAGALYAQHVLDVELIAYEDLGPEAIRRLRIEAFPVIVVNDCDGNDAYAEARALWQKP
jgi:fumarate hydratase subunit beta